MNSMTGYAQGEFDAQSLRFSLEIKSYNNRYLELGIQLPGYLGALEPRLRNYFQARIRRGKVDFSLRVRELKLPVSVTVDERAAAAGAEALAKLQALLDPSQKPTLSALMRMEGILSLERDIDAERLWSEIEPSLESVARVHAAERAREGKHLAKDIRAQAKVLREGAAFILERSPELERTIRENLRKRFQETLGNLVDENRVLQETAVALMRYTINEELARLGSHLDALDACMDEEGEPGKRIDFICQEINREVNTIGSKCQLGEVAMKVVAMKEAVENIREQARNIE
jgi:uncharacterized protein (TIGR00255 family)